MTGQDMYFLIFNEDGKTRIDILDEEEYQARMHITPDGYDYYNSGQKFDSVAVFPVGGTFEHFEQMMDNHDLLIIKGSPISPINTQ